MEGILKTQEEKDQILLTEKEETQELEVKIKEEQEQKAAPDDARLPRRFIAPAGFAVEASFWDRIYATLRQKYTVTGNIASISYHDKKPVWEVIFPEWPEVRGMVPQNETMMDESVFYKFVGQDVFLRIKGCDPENGLIACSYTEAVDAVRDRVYQSIAEGEIIPVVVKAIILNPPRLVVDVGGGVLAEIKAKDARRYFSRYLSEQYQPGQQVNALVKNLKPLALSIRDTYPNPWTSFSFVRGQILVGNVVNVKDDFMFIEPDISPGLLGTAPIPLMGSILPGDRVQCSVTRFLRNERKLNLRVKNRISR